MHNRNFLPGVIERDELQKFPKDEINKMGQMGFLGMMTSPKYGGGGMDTVSYILAMEEISKIDASSSVIMSVNNSLVCWGIGKYGTEEQKQKYLPKLTSGEHIGAFAYQNLKLALMPHHKEQQQLKKKDHYVLNGTKNWITNGNSASIYLVIAQSDVEKKHKGINAFIVERLGWNFYWT